VNLKLLIDAIVGQTMVLIAQLATVAGARAPLAHVANQVFLDLTAELEAQGVRRKVVADMFGLALRTYQKRVQRVSEGATEHGRSLWEAVFAFLQEGRVTSRAEVLRRFRHDDEATLRGILQDLVASGLVFRTGSGRGRAYRVATDEELGLLGQAEQGEGAESLVWLTVYRHGPLKRDALEERLRMPRATLDRILLTLRDEGRVTLEERDGETVLSSREFVLPVGSPAGWEAAFYDHYQAVVSTLCAKLHAESATAGLADRIGGSTYSFDVWPGHEHELEALELLSRMRRQLTSLRDRVVAHNQAVGKPASFQRVSFYMGQSVLDKEREDANGD
jgi:hypothetical protein